MNYKFCFVFVNFSNSNVNVMGGSLVLYCSVLLLASLGINSKATTRTVQFRREREGVGAGASTL